MSTETPLTVRIVEMLEDAKGDYPTAKIAEALGVENKRVSAALSKLVKQGKVDRNEAGNYSAPWKEQEATPEPEPVVEDEPTPVEETPETDLPKAGDKAVDIKAWKAKIAKTLAKAERTENDHERDAYTAAAEKMMLRLGIHRAELEAVGAVHKEKIVEVKREWHGNYSIAMLPFVNMVADGFGHLIVLQSSRSAMLRTSYIIGPESVVEEFCRLLDSLFIQVMPALKRWQRDNADARRGLTDMVRFVQNRSFITGFGQEVGSRLAKARQTEEGDMSTGAELVVANRDQDVTDWVTAAYPVLGKARGMQYNSAAARQAGREAGKPANLNEGKKAVESE